MNTLQKIAAASVLSLGVGGGAGYGISQAVNESNRIANDPVARSKEKGPIKMIDIKRDDMEKVYVMKQDYVDKKYKFDWSSMNVVLVLKNGKLNEYNLRVLSPDAFIFEELPKVKNKE
ncbi:MAG: hypothetical protein HY094_04995 [Candidatus Melainabacteria bacterium]|nr:hypothetical protein [Candidatus Melainabacteria bacterium]